MDDAKIDKRCLGGANGRLKTFVRAFVKELPRSESRENATLFVKGLLSDIKRKNIEAIAYRFERDRRALQRFIGEAVWNHQLLLDRIAKETAKLIGEDDGILAFDPSGFEKDGKMSAGVARQYCALHKY